MVPFLKQWFQNFKATYVGNAQAVRDYRAQLRGTRPIIFWGSYLAALILTATIAYGNLVHEGQDFGTGQQALHGVYQILMLLLGIVMCIAAPALTATAVTQERQRRSLDLVACAPITTRYFLVGKMLSSFRYIWMLLILSLPVTSMCVVLGGATWGDVLAGYVLLSASGLIMTALSLLVSSLSKTGIAALNIAYMAIMFLYLPVTYILGVPGLTGGSYETPWYTGLFPLLAPLAAPTYSTLFGAAIPNYLLVSLFSLFAVRYILLGTSSVMGHYGSNDIRKFRQSSLAAIAFAGVGLTTLLRYVMPNGVFSNGASAHWQPIIAQLAAPAGLLLMLLTCYLSVSSRNADERFRDDGLFNPRKIWIGTPSSALPYMLLVFLSSFGLSAAYMLPTFGVEAFGFQMAVAVWTLGGIFMSWLVARVVSQRNMAIPQARVTSSLVVAAFFAIPSMILTLAGATQGQDFFSSDIWKLTFIAFLNGKVDALSVVAQLLLMAMLSLLCVRQLRKSPAKVGDRLILQSTGSAAALPTPEEQIFGIDEVRFRRSREAAAEELRQPPQSP